MSFPRPIPDLVEYYSKYLELIELHRRLNFGTAPRSSEGLTESICAQLYTLTKPIGVHREYDLIDMAKGIKIEVKATTGSNGSTTMNPNAGFDYLYWMVLLTDQHFIAIHKIPSIAFANFKQENKSLKRASVYLKDFKAESSDYFAVDTELKSIFPVTVSEQLERIKQIFAA